MPPFQLGFGYAAGRGRAGSGCAHSLEFFSQGPLLNFKETNERYSPLGTEGCKSTCQLPSLVVRCYVVGQVGAHNGNR